ncbi:MAG: hypothetical protein KAS38_10640 [Anaerolineales bacterium]|nr:hypothetical protein [Anaerolineales bacterium]
MNHSGCELIAAVTLLGGTRLALAAPDQASPEANSGAWVIMGGFDEEGLIANTPSG